MKDEFPLSWREMVEAGDTAEQFNRDDSVPTIPDDYKNVALLNGDAAQIKALEEALSLACTTDKEQKERIKLLKKSLAWALGMVDGNEYHPMKFIPSDLEAPDHVCSYDIAPDEGYCRFCEMYWEAMDALCPGLPPDPAELEEEDTEADRARLENDHTTSLGEL